VSTLSLSLTFHLNLLRFAETEGAAVLTILISQYIISVEDELQFSGETYEERKARVLDARSTPALAHVEFLLL